MLFQAVNSLIQAGKQNKLARSINPVNTTYEESVRSGGENPYIQALYGQGRNLYQGRMEGASQAEQNLLTNQSNTISSIENNAGDASTVLAAAAGVGGQTNDALVDLSTAEGADKRNRFGIYSNVSQLMAQEGDKVYQDKLRSYYDDLNYKRSLEGSAMQNKANFWGGLDDTIKTGISLLSPGGALSGVLGGGGGGSRIPAPNNSGVQTVPGSYVPGAGWNNRQLYTRG